MPIWMKCGDGNLSHCAWLALSWSIVFAYVFSLIVTLRVHVFEPIPLASGQKRKTKTCMVIRFVVSCFMFQDGHLAWRRTSDVRDSTRVYNVCVYIYIFIYLFFMYIYTYFLKPYIYICIHIQVHVYIRESYLTNDTVYMSIQLNARLSLQNFLQRWLCQTC